MQALPTIAPSQIIQLLNKQMNKLKNEQMSK